MTPQMAVLMAGYNRWMNSRMFDAAARLDDAALAADSGAFFGSILGTLNHIAVADTIWLHRFARHPAEFDSLGALTGFPQPTSLSQALAPDLAALRSYRDALDERVVRLANELRPEHLSADITYSSTTGERACRNFGALLQHFFNHQTHHRGQASTLLSQRGVDIGVTDLLALIPRVEP